MDRQAGRQTDRQTDRKWAWNFTAAKPALSAVLLPTWPHFLIFLILFKQLHVLVTKHSTTGAMRAILIQTTRGPFCWD